MLSESTALIRSRYRSKTVYPLLRGRLGKSFLLLLFLIALVSVEAISLNEQ